MKYQDDLLVNLAWQTGEPPHSIILLRAGVGIRPHVAIYQNISGGRWALDLQPKYIPHQDVTESWEWLVLPQKEIE